MLNQEQIFRSLSKRDTSELHAIWELNDRDEWTEEAFVAIEQILRKRGESLRPQRQVTQSPTEAPSERDSARRWAEATTIPTVAVVGFAVGFGLGYVGFILLVVVVVGFGFGFGLGVTRRDAVSGFFFVVVGFAVGHFIRDLGPLDGQAVYDRSVGLIFDLIRFVVSFVVSFVVGVVVGKWEP